MTNQNLLYIGTYNTDFDATSADNDGIYIYSFDDQTGALARIGTVGDIANPTYLAIDSNGRNLYAVTELQNVSASVVTAYAIERESGALTRLNQQPANGKICAWITLDRSEKLAMIANYGGGEASVALLPINTDGHLQAISSSHTHEGTPSGVVAHRQEAIHPHHFMADPSNTIALACDLGLDQVKVYRLDADTQTLTKIESATHTTAPGAGPRHLAYHPTLNRVYVLNELNSTLEVLSLDRESGTLTTHQTLPALPDNFDAHNQCSGIHITPDGRYVYAGNRGHDSLAIYAVDMTTGDLSIVGHHPTGGENPRGFAIDPTGQFVIVGNQDSDSIVVFRIDANTGTLQDTGVMVECPKPACIKVVTR